MTTRLETVVWVNGAVEFVDQTLLPHQEEMRRCDTVDLVIDAISRLVVRGAPAIGVAGAYGVALAASKHHPVTDAEKFLTDVKRIRDARPTAVNLARMVDRTAVAKSFEEALRIADQIREEERVASINMGELGADFLLEHCGDRPLRVMTICNTGALAAIERGTALAVIQTLHERGKLAEALPLETRPLLQGGRLTAWELQRMGAPFRLLVDSAAASLLARGYADAIVTGADRIAANGDTANKVGTFSLALAAQYAKVPFVVVAPESTVDVSTRSGADIHIEERSSDEVVSFKGVDVSPAGTKAINPAFDVTPVSLIEALVTDQRVVWFRRGEQIS
jgi:methylthioribose-1-phosphate isomerase